MLSGSDGVAAGSIHNNNALLGRGYFVNIVKARACPADNFEVRCGLDDLCGYLWLLNG